MVGAGQTTIVSDELKLSEGESIKVGQEEQEIDSRGRHYCVD